MADVKEVKISGHIQETVANPSALGLLGLAMVTLVASSQKLGITDGTMYIIPWALFLELLPSLWQVFMTLSTTILLALLLSAVMVFSGLPWLPPG